MLLFGLLMPMADELPTPSAARLDSVSKCYRGGVWAVRELTLQLPAGRITALVGPNGAGKSTTLNLMGGVIRPTQGTVVVRSANGRIGWCPQTNLIDWSL